MSTTGSGRVGASLQLSFDWLGSGVDWSDTFWTTDHVGTGGWLVYSGASSLSGFPNLVISGTNWGDAQGDMLQTVQPGATFTTYQSGNDVFPNDAVQAVPEPSTWAMLAAGAVVFGIRELRRRRSRTPA